MKEPCLPFCLLPMIHFSYTGGILQETPIFRPPIYSGLAFPSSCSPLGPLSLGPGLRPSAAVF